MNKVETLPITMNYCSIGCVCLRCLDLDKYIEVLSNFPFDIEFHSILQQVKGIES